MRGFVSTVDSLLRGRRSASLVGQLRWERVLGRGVPASDPAVSVEFYVLFFGG